jgi:hypothetical protein
MLRLDRDKDLPNLKQRLVQRLQNTDKGRGQEGRQASKRVFEDCLATCAAPAGVRQTHQRATQAGRQENMHCQLAGSQRECLTMIPTGLSQFS